MQKYIWIADKWDDKQANAINPLNRMLKDVGVTFSVEPPTGTHRQLVVTIDEDTLDKATKKSSGRPQREFDYQKVLELKEKGYTNKQIADELGISISLFYLRMKDYKNNNWTMLEQKDTKRWELVYDTDEKVVATGYFSSDLELMIKAVGYMNQGKKSDLPDCVIKNLEFIKKNGI